MKGRSIIVGGGIQAVAPFALNFVPFVSDEDPASLSTTDFLLVVPTGATRGLIINKAGTDPQPAATEVLRIAGGAIIEGAVADSTLIGRGAITPGTGTYVLIGRTITGSNLASNDIGIGTSVNLSGGSGVCIGSTASIRGGGSASSVCIGFGSTVTAGATAGLVVNIGITNSVSASRGVAIGNGVILSVDSSVAIGRGASVSGNALLAIGTTNISASASNAIAIGSASSSHANAVVIGIGGAASYTTELMMLAGDSGAAFTTFHVGGPNLSGTPTALTFRMGNASGTNIAAGSLTIIPGRSTGNIATGGNIIFQTGEPGASGTTLQTATTRLTIAQALITSTLPIVHPAGTAAAPSILFTDADTGLFEQAAGNVAITAQGTERARFDGTAVAGNTAFLVFDVDNAALERVTVGAADSGGAGFKVLRIPN